MSTITITVMSSPLGRTSCTDQGFCAAGQPRRDPGSTTRCSIQWRYPGASLTVVVTGTVRGQQPTVTTRSEVSYLDYGH